MFATFDRFAIEMTKAQAESASHPGPCDDGVQYLLTLPKIRRQLKRITDDELRAELREYGAWIEGDLDQRENNEARIIWLAAGHIADKL